MPIEPARLAGEGLHVPYDKASNKDAPPDRHRRAPVRRARSRAFPTSRSTHNQLLSVAQHAPRAAPHGRAYAETIPCPLLFDHELLDTAMITEVTGLLRQGPARPLPG